MAGFLSASRRGGSGGAPDCRRNWGKRLSKHSPRNLHRTCIQTCRSSHPSPRAADPYRNIHNWGAVPASFPLYITRILAIIHAKGVRHEITALYSYPHSPACFCIDGGFTAVYLVPGVYLQGQFRACVAELWGDLHWLGLARVSARRFTPPARRKERKGPLRLSFS